MSRYLGLDLGSTSVTAVVIDTAARAVTGISSRANDAELTSPADRARGRSEWDFERMLALSLRCAREACEGSGVEAVEAVGVTGQQKGCQVLAGDGTAIGPYIGWQDRRTAEPAPGQAGGATWLDLMAERGGATTPSGQRPRFTDSGCPVAHGFTVPLLFWLQQAGELPAGAHAGTAPELLVARLTGTRAVTDPTDAAGWGVFDVIGGVWNGDLVRQLGLDPSLLPEVVRSCRPGGRLRPEMADAMGLRPDVPVSVASGDMQCSYAGAVADRDASVAVNVGTAGQCSVFVGDLEPLRTPGQPFDHGWLELRPYIEQGHLLAGLGVVGGRTLRALRDFVLTVADALGHGDSDPEGVYDDLVRCAQAVPAGAEGVLWDPSFTGGGTDASARASMTGLTPQNFTIGHVARGLLEAVARELHGGYETARQMGAGPRTMLVGSGNGLQRNPVLRAALAERFGMPLTMAPNAGAAAVGAALCGAVAAGEYPDIAAASRRFLSPA
ncbi:MAG: FGGY family carbohydrate kinase [Spirochaetaceae bacterium]|nr:FGGY family carbohydrate kinase [Spirochaetaceae bacterium]